VWRGDTTAKIDGIVLRIGIHEGEVVLKSLCMHNIPENLREEWNYNKMLG
jgi:hypothetical protein